MSDYFERDIPAGQSIKPWLILGPYYEDLSAQVQGLTLFERMGATVGRTAIREIVDQAAPILTSTPRESAAATFRGTDLRWDLVRLPEPYHSWGTYNISNHLGAAFVSTSITPDEAGERQFRLLFRIAQYMVVMINGERVWDNLDIPFTAPGGPVELGFAATLKPGENVLTIGMFRLARMAQVGFRLTVDTGVQAQVNLSLPVAQRAQVEDSVRSVRLERDVFYPEHRIGFVLGQAPGFGSLHAELSTPGAELLTEISDVQAGESVLRQSRANGNGSVALGHGDVPDGAYQLRCLWVDEQNQPITETRYDIRVVTPYAPLPGYEHMATRQRMALEHYTSDRGGPRPIWGEVALYALGRYDEIDESILRQTCNFIKARKDCADFSIQGVLRLLAWEFAAETRHLSDEIHALMKDTVLGFKYWVDEPGDTVMYMGSENHRLLFHVAEWLAGQLFPTEEFTNSLQRGLYHATKGRMYITEWLRRRGRFGFDEYHSNSYYPIVIAPLINVYDFAIHEDYRLKHMARTVLDYMFYNLAADTFHGVFGSPHGRSYGINLKYPDFEGTTALCWLMFGEGAMSAGTSGIGPVPVATSGYTLPRILADIATDREAVIYARIRQGLFDKIQEQSDHQHAYFTIYRTPDYMIAGIQDHHKGEPDAALMVAQVTLDNKAVIFWNCPHTSNEGSGLRPDYWSGSTTLPRVIQHQNVMALTWRLTDIAWLTHCWFEQSHFDEVRFHDNWAFARVGQGYVGIYSQHGLVVGQAGQYAGRELQCFAPENTWLVECGRAADWGSFDAFVDALQSAQVTVNGDVVTYASPSVGTFVTGWHVPPAINGEPVQTRDYPLVDSDWAYSRFGSGEMTIRHGNDVLDLWFNL
jgi:hypothetical protein